MHLKPILLSLALLGVSAGCQSTSVPSASALTGVLAVAAATPASAPVASVDRFSDSFGQLFKRSAPGFDPTNTIKVIPAANAPIDMDKYFTVKSLGPAGEKVTYYALDVLSNVPGKAYQLVDASGNPIPGQLPIITALPGDPGYNDFVEITKATVPAGYTANVLASVDDLNSAVAAGQVKLSPTTTIQNWAMVPAGTTANLKFLGKTATGNQAWYKKTVANYLQFDTSLTAMTDGTVPESPIIVIFNDGKSPASGFKADATGQTHNVLDTLPGQPPYSSLWSHDMQGNPAGFDAVVDYPSAVKNENGPLGVLVNCPIVAP